LLLIIVGSILFLILTSFYFIREKTNAFETAPLKTILYTFIFILFLVVGFYRANVTDFKTQIIFDPKQTYNFNGYIVAEPENRESSKRICFNQKNM
jgi:hypothetical protein